MKIEEITSKTILNPTGGFLGEGFTHTINLYRGCALGNSLCGQYCYAQWNQYHLKGRPWGSFLDVKTDFLEAYRRQYDQLKHPPRSEPKPLKIFMSSVTEPYPPQELTARRTRQLLEEMVDRPPDLLVIQSHTPLVVDDIPVLSALQAHCQIQINITVETDMEALPHGFSRSAYSPVIRMQALERLKWAGLNTVCTISPLLPLDDPRGFAQALHLCCDRVILDHYLLGDGSKDGQRTNRTKIPTILIEAGFEEWTRLDKFQEVVKIFRDVFGNDERVGVSQSGFNFQTY